MGITFVLWLTALRLSTTTAQISILIYLSPAMSLVFIWLVLKESIHPTTIIGLALIVPEYSFSKKRTRINARKFSHEDAKLFEKKQLGKSGDG